jgi:hypothetical protein
MYKDQNLHEQRRRIKLEMLENNFGPANVSEEYLSEAERYTWIWQHKDLGFLCISAQLTQIKQDWTQNL